MITPVSHMYFAFKEHFDYNKIFKKYFLRLEKKVAFAFENL